MTCKLELLEIHEVDKIGAIQTVGEYFTKRGFKLIDLDVLRPWGFYFYFDVGQTKQFVDYFFQGIEFKGINTSLPLQPKVLVFEPDKMVSWQYHHRRSEIWRCITESCRIVMSKTDVQTTPNTINFGDVVNFTQGTRHRGGAPLKKWGAVAENWQHTDPNNLSDETDIIRLQDNFGRK